MPEPPDGAWVVVGEDSLVLLVRDDYSAREAGYEAPYRWFYGHDDVEPPLSWAQVTGAIQRVYTQAELDTAVAQARAEAGIIPVGEHLIEAGGYCRTCGVLHSTVEVARLEDRLVAEGGQAGG